MSKLDDINTLKRLLAEFDLPVSPILEYAITEIEEGLSSENEGLAGGVVADSIQTKEQEVRHVSSSSKRLRVTTDDGSVIQCEKTCDTMVAVIKRIGAKRVQELSIMMADKNIITDKPDPYSRSSDYHDVGDGLYVNTHCNTKQKKSQLNRIFFRLRLPWTVSID